MTGIVPKVPPTIDVHAHLGVAEVTEWARPHAVQNQPPPADLVSDAARAQTAAWVARVRERMSSLAVRCADMDRMGVDVQILSSMSVTTPTYWAPAAAGLAAEQRINDAIAAAVAAHPDRFRGMGGLPMQDTALAIKEMARCIDELGFIGFQIGACVAELELGDRNLWPFWEAAEARGVVIFIHPTGLTEARFAKWQIWNSIGQPLEEAMAMASLMYEGVLDAFPRLKICVAHGGGYLPYYIGRLDRNYTEKPLTRVKMQRSPSEYLKFFYYDSCLYDADPLRNLVRKIGADRIVVGSDYPVGDEDPVGFVRNCQGLTQDQKERILRGTAAELFGGMS